MNLDTGFESRLPVDRPIRSLQAPDHRHSTPVSVWFDFDITFIEYVIGGSRPVVTTVPKPESFPMHPHSVCISNTPAGSQTEDLGQR